MGMIACVDVPGATVRHRRHRLHLRSDDFRLTYSQTTATGLLAGTNVHISSYARLAGFVEEAAVVGRVRVQRIEFPGSSSATRRYWYGAQRRRPTRVEIQRNGASFTARPTQTGIRLAAR